VGWRPCRAGTLHPRIQPPQQPVQVGAGAAPVERDGGLLVAALEGEQATLDLGEVTEVVKGEHLAPHDREIELHLVEPGLVDGQSVLPSGLPVGACGLYLADLSAWQEQLPSANS
jgi:hypothetical protein